MKLSVTQENLAKALSVVGRVVGNRATLPVLVNTLLKTESNRLKLSATNLEMGINYWIGGKVDEKGAITVPARLLSELITTLPSEKIELELEKTTLKIKTPNHKSQINGIEAEEFPSIPAVKGDSSFTVASDQLKAALSQTTLVASADDSRPVLNGVYLFTKGDTLFVVATDSYRLAEKTIKMTKKPKGSDSIDAIVPARTMQELLRIIGDADEDIEVLIDEGQVMFKIGDIELISRLIEGKFPDYKQLIPSETESRAVLSTDDFMNVTKTASLFAAENAGSVTVRVDEENKKLEIHSVAAQVGENTSQVPAEVKGAGAEVALNSRYITDALSVVGAEQVEFGITGKVNPCVIKPVGSEKDYIHIIMPLRS